MIYHNLVPAPGILAAEKPPMSGSNSNSSGGIANNRRNDGDSEKLLLIVLCIFIPPVAIFWLDRDVTFHFVLNIILCFLFWLPGIIHALWYCFFRGK